MEAKIAIGLSEAGQKDALARGLPAQREQVVTVAVDNGDIKFFQVDSAGGLSLNLHYCGSAERGSSGNWKDLSFDREKEFSIP